MAFLTKEEEQEIVKAITQAEQNTSGEIRVHIEASTKKSHTDRTREVFRKLEMENTQLRNGVLIYIAYKDRCFEIYGDEGINNLVADDFWESTRDAILKQFKANDFKQGIIDGVLQIGEVLKDYFPYNPDNDINELPNEISRG